MRMSARLPIAAIAGTGLFLAANYGFESLNSPIENQTNKIMACAEALGHSALTTTTLPEACNNDIAIQTISSQQSISNNYKKYSDSKTIYFLPSKEQYIATNISTLAEQKAKQYNDNIIFFASSVIAFAGAGIAYEITKKENS